MKKNRTTGGRAAPCGPCIDRVLSGKSQTAETALSQTAVVVTRLSVVADKPQWRCCGSRCAECEADSKPDITWRRQFERVGHAQVSFHKRIDREQSTDRHTDTSAYSATCDFLTRLLAVPPWPQDGTVSVFILFTISVQLCDRLYLLILQGAPVTDLFVKSHLKLHIDIALHYITFTTQTFSAHTHTVNCAA